MNEPKINLSMHENSSLPTINLGRGLEQSEGDQIEKIISMCAQKLAYGGKLSIQGLHLESFCKEFIFGIQPNSNLLLNIKSINPIDKINFLLNQNRLKITSLELNNGVYYLEATK